MSEPNVLQALVLDLCICRPSSWLASTSTKSERWLPV